jgi:hypothetical protein
VGQFNMWPFNNKQPEKTPEKKKKVVWHEENWDLGITLVRIVLEDGTVLHKEFCGEYNSSYADSISVHLYSVGTLLGGPNYSKDVAFQFMQTLKNCNFGLCDREDTAKVYYSNPNRAEIIETRKDIKTIQVPYVGEE